MYKVIWRKIAEMQLTKIHRDVAMTIKDKVAVYLSQEPYANSHPLKGEFKGLWTHGIARYRVIYSIDEEHQTIIVVGVGPRRSIYD